MLSLSIFHRVNNKVTLKFSIDNGLVTIMVFFCRMIHCDLCLFYHLDIFGSRLCNVFNGRIKGNLLVRLKVRLFLTFKDTLYILSVNCHCFETWQMWSNLVFFLHKDTDLDNEFVALCNLNSSYLKPDDWWFMHLLCKI